MKLNVLYIALMLMGSACSSGLPETIQQVNRIPTEETNLNYASNKKPLIPQQFIKLPTGAIKPGGWLLTQLQPGIVFFLQPGTDFVQVSA